MLGGKPAATVCVLATFIYSGFFSVSHSQESAPKENKVNTSGMTIVEKIMHSTVQLRCTTGNGTYSFGTAFFFIFKNGENKTVTGLISNKHVFDANMSLQLRQPSQSCEFTATKTKNDGTPDYNSNVTVKISDIEHRLVKHPDDSIDIATVIVTDLIKDANSENGQLFIVSLSDNAIVTPAAISNSIPNEEMMTVGYPGNYWDYVNNLPVVHRAITASPLYFDFQESINSY